MAASLKAPNPGAGTTKSGSVDRSEVGAPNGLGGP